MSIKIQALLDRATTIGRSLQETGKVEALIGFGSLSETKRLDSHSDLDFLVVPKQEYQEEIINDLSWLESVAPVLIKCKFTEDGYKVLFEDGILCDFGILTSDQIRSIAHDKGRVIWSQLDFDDSVCEANHECNYISFTKQQIEKYFDLALIDIFVGLNRLNRGEVYSATKIIQEDALEKVLIAITNQKNSLNSKVVDKFQISRYFEKVNQEDIHILEQVILGYRRNKEAAETLINIIGYHHFINENVRVILQNLLKHPVK